MIAGVFLSFPLPFSPVGIPFKRIEVGTDDCGMKHDESRVPKFDEITPA